MTRTVRSDRGSKNSGSYKRRNRVSVKLNTSTVRTMVDDILKKLYGITPYGQLRYFVDSTAMISLQEAAETFLENMWHDLIHQSIKTNLKITVRDVQCWKRKHDFKVRVKKNELSLCKIFESRK